MKNRVCSWLVCKIGVREILLLASPLYHQVPQHHHHHGDIAGNDDAVGGGSTPALSPAIPS